MASRYTVGIGKHLETDGLRQKISLELNSTHISHAVNTFIDVKVSELGWGKTRNSELQKVRNHLYQNAEGTFGLLWSANISKMYHLGR